MYIRVYRFENMDSGSDCPLYIMGKVAAYVLVYNNIDNIQCQYTIASFAYLIQYVQRCQDIR